MGDRPARTVSRANAAGQLTEGNAHQVNARLRGHGWAVLSEAIAHEMHLHIGESFTLPSPNPTTFRLAGLSTNGGWPPGAIVINAEDYARAWGSNAASALNVQVAPPDARRRKRAIQIIRSSRTALRPGRADGQPNAKRSGPDSAARVSRGSRR